MEGHNSPGAITRPDGRGRALVDEVAGTRSVATAERASTGLLMTVEQVAELWFGEVGAHGSASANCQKIRRLIPQVLPARRIGNRWYVSRSAAEAWADTSDPASVMAHPETRAALQRAAGGVQ